MTFKPIADKTIRSVDREAVSVKPEADGVLEPNGETLRTEFFGDQVFDLRHCFSGYNAHRAVLASLAKPASGFPVVRSRDPRSSLGMDIPKIAEQDKNLAVFMLDKHLDLSFAIREVDLHIVEHDPARTLDAQPECALRPDLRHRNISLSVGLQ
jgi:hypothetical protein